MLVRSKASDRFWQFRVPGKLAKFTSVFGAMIDRFPNLAYGGLPDASWSNNWLPTNGVRTSLSRGYDLAHLHWIGGGFASSAELKRLDKPIVWTLHDTMALAGGCHYVGDCENFTVGCGCCPQLGSRRTSDLSRINASARRRAVGRTRMHVVCPSRWLADLAGRSSVFRSAAISIIPNGIDLSTYRPADRAIARDILGLPQDSKLVGYGAMGALTDKRKGGDLLFAALAKLPVSPKLPFGQVIFGASAPDKTSEQLRPAIYLGQIKDDATLRLLYSALDVVVVPSREENLSNVIMEAMACGTPVCAFDIGGNGEMIEHRVTGYLARREDVGDLASGILFALETPGLGPAARQKCEEAFDLAKVARRYIDLYETLVGTDP
jgi:glycosyltransferase involved in cell wall biosynthesis